MWAMPHSRIAGMNARFAKRNERHGSARVDMGRDSSERGSKSKATGFLKVRFSKAMALDPDAERVEERVGIGLDRDRLAPSLDRIRRLQAVAGHEQDDAIVLADLAAADGFAQRAERHARRR